MRRTFLVLSATLLAACAAVPSTAGALPNRTAGRLDGRTNASASVLPRHGGWWDYETIPVEERTLGRIAIPRIGVDSPIIEGVDDFTIRVGVGHFPETALPDESGNMALAAHRTTDFYGLRFVRPGDRITVTSALGEAHYVVDRTWVVAPEDLTVLDPTDSRSLTLITCYPFDYPTSAPERFVVRAHAVDTPQTVVTGRIQADGPETNGPPASDATP